MLAYLGLLCIYYIEKFLTSKHLPFYVSLVMSNLHFDGPALTALL